MDWKGQVRPLSAAALVAATAAGGACRTQPSPADLERSAATVLGSDVARRVGIIAHDSMLGRDTHSAGLDQTAEYIAGEFARLGLRPGGDTGSFLQRYPVTRRRLLPARSTLVFARAGRGVATLRFTRDAAFAQGEVPPAPLGGEVVLLGGGIDPERIPAAELADKVVLWLADWSPAGLAQLDAISASIVAAGPRAVVVVPNDSAVVAGARGAQEALRTAREDPRGVLQFTAVLADQRAITAGAGDAARLFAETRRRPETVARRLEGWTATLTLADTVVERRSAPNVVGILDGADRALRQEYLVFSAHMDHLGVASGIPGDSIFNGADDDGSGTAGVLELAQAFTRPGARPRRSVIFLTVSGEEKGLWGSAWFTQHPPVAVARLVADLNLDMIGRGWADSVAAIGREHSDLGETLARVAARHPELRMTPVGDRWPAQKRFYRSDHYNFARQGVPILFFSTGYSPDYHLPSDSPEKVDGEKEARLLRLVFYLGEEVANAAARPQWRPESYRTIVRRP